MDTGAENIYWQNHSVTQAQRRRTKNQKPCVIWFTGLSGSGKSTIAGELEQQLLAQSCHTYLLDGDNVRHGLCRDLGFSDTDREENIRRVGEVAALMVDAGLMVLAAFISPFIKDRDMVRQMVQKDQFLEVFVHTPIEICRQRDPKGLYRRADLGEIPDFTGVDSPYEPPQCPEIHIDAGSQSVAACVNQVLAKIQPYLATKRIAELES